VLLVPRGAAIAVPKYPEGYRPKDEDDTERYLNWLGQHVNDPPPPKKKTGGGLCLIMVIAFATIVGIVLYSAQFVV
jgi:hypothetical protein